MPTERERLGATAQVILDITPTTQIDWDSAGRRLYHVPFTFDNTWGRARVPLYVACGPRPGKTVVAIGGTHGDEYEGPVGLKNLIRELDPATIVAGRLIVIPVLNVPAFQAGERGSPLDGGNMNRVFPGDANGTITQRIARFMTDEVLTRADIVIDIHAGGKGFEIARCVSFHQVPDPELLARCRETALLFGMPFVMVYTRGMGTRLLTEQAEAMGKITVGGEFGYGASTDLAGVRWAHHGVLNVMRHNGLLDSPIESLTPPGLDRQRFVVSTDIDRWITTPVSGISEPLVPLGAFVTAGTPVTRIHDFDRIDESGVEIRADQNGYVLCRRFHAPTQQGDIVMVIARETA
ncbi:MAG TPA: succinylglutamate desuccinylase/aspartoacylase family protein [Thermomicrobiales bacterium]|nr:succinylglutamate desuccinylase/aspartoacylase family protein [Thermomicrobiales bacterium]